MFTYDSVNGLLTFIATEDSKYVTSQKINQVVVYGLKERPTLVGTSKVVSVPFDYDQTLQKLSVDVEVEFNLTSDDTSEVVHVHFGNYEVKK